MERRLPCQVDSSSVEILADLVTRMAFDGRFVQLKQQIFRPAAVGFSGCQADLKVSRWVFPVGRCAYSIA
jgi:hypothetical protein